MKASTLHSSHVPFIREAALSSMALGIGLTHIRRYDFIQPGFFYSGLYSVTAGIERLLKLIVIYDYRLRNKGVFPNNDTLKKFSHNLKELITHAREINGRHGFETSHEIDDPLVNTIVSCLSDFATNARYYNLDILTGRKQGPEEPLARWNSEVCTEMIRRHYHPAKNRVERMKAVGEVMNEIAIACHTTESGSLLSLPSDLIMHGLTITIKQKYSTYYLYIIIRFLCALLDDLESKGDFFPFLREFYQIFRIEEKSWILRKKSWNPMPPYVF